MTTKQFIERAIEGGWHHEHDFNVHTRGDGQIVVQFFGENDWDIATILLDPEAWKAVGKVEGWEEQDFYWDIRMPTWQKKMHRMLDALAEGKTIEQYLETL